MLGLIPCCLNQDGMDKRMDQDLEMNQDRMD